MPTPTATFKAQMGSHGPWDDSLHTEPRWLLKPCTFDGVHSLLRLLLFLGNPSPMCPTLRVLPCSFPFPECFYHSGKKGIVLTQERQGSSLAPLKTSFWRIPNRPWCFKMSFAFNPDEGRKITKEGPDPKWILLSSTWFILNVKVQGYKNKWIEWGICEFWSVDISPCLEDVLKYLCTFCHCWIKRVTDAMEHCNQNDVINK